ncbi:hypothetical protein C7212DRAFT_299938 [Tuber magnatum]|uniref:Uncharacterized protein n=1 Tax=Tuber magnatum TaxID=42249 RepID=A0A317SGS7_9PEZI|nr:hypothetical protein C7212DRAFT_299938 [Tuber magnatum]
MAENSVWQTFAFFPPTPLPSGYFWDVEEIRHQEHLHRVSHAQFLYSHRTDSPEAMRVYRDFLSEQSAWMAEQEELREREAQVSMQAHVDRASRWAEERRRLESGETVEDVLMQTGAALTTKSPFKPEHHATCADTGSIPRDDDTTPKSISTLNLPESLIDWGQGRNSCKGLPRVGVNCVPGHIPGFDQVGGTATARIQNSGLDPAEITRKLQQNLDRQVRCKPSEQDPSQSSSLDRDSATNKFVVKPIISFPPPDLGPPKKSGTENFYTSKLPYAMTSIIRKDTGLAGGEVVKICSHKRWTDGGGLLYETLWKPHDLNTPPLKIWVKSVDFMDANKRAILDEYHLRNKLGTVHWRSQSKKKLRTSASLGVKEIKDALDERKRSLIASGRYNGRTAELLGKCRWMMRGEWQQRGRGWAAAIEVVERWKKAWQDADKAERQIGLSLEREAAPGVTVNAGENGLPCSKEVESELVPSPPRVRLDNSPSFKQFDGGHVIGPERDHDPQPRDNHKITREDVEEWRNFFGGIDCLGPIMVDVTDSSTIGGISESGITKTFPKAVETWRIGCPGSLTPEIRNINRRKGEFINLLKRDRFTRKSVPEAAWTPVSVQSVSETGCHLAHERETLFSRLFIKDGHQNNTMGAATTAAYTPILQPSGVIEARGGSKRTPAAVSTPLDGETGERDRKSQNEIPRLNRIATQEGVGRDDARTQGVIPGVLTKDVAIQTSPSTELVSGLRIGQSVVMSSGSTKTIGEQLDDDWRVRFLELFSQTPGLSNLLAGARAYTGDCGSTQTTEYVHSPAVSFGLGGGHMSWLDREEATERDSGGNTGQKKENGSKRRKHKRGLGTESGRNRIPPRRVALPQGLARSQDGVLLLPGEVRRQEESLAQEVPPAEGKAPTKLELAMQALNDSNERAKARGKELKNKKQEEGLTREECKEYKKLKRLLVRYRATRWFLAQVDILIEKHRRQ